MQILAAAITGLVIKKGETLGDEGYGDAPFAIMNGALEILNAVEFCDQDGLLESKTLREFVQSNKYLVDLYDPAKIEEPTK